MFRCILTLTLVAGSFLAFSNLEAKAQLVVRSTSATASSGFNASRSVGPGGVVRSVGGFQNASVTQSNLLQTGLGAIGNSTTTSAGRNFAVSQGVIGGTAFRNVSGGRTATTTNTRIGSGIFAPLVP